MNALQLNSINFEFSRLGLDERTGLNLLNEENLISDQCVTLEDIPDGDAQKSLEWLRKQPTKLVSK